MTARDLIAAALRRWYVVVLGAAVTMGALSIVQQQAPVWWTQYNIVFLGPSGTQHGNVLEHPRYGLQPLVGVIATDINDGHPPLLTGDVAATIVGQGHREGIQVRVPNLGTQWRPVFSANYLDVQVAGATPEEVLASARATTERVQELLTQRQDEMDAPAKLRAEAVPSSEDPIIVPVSGSRPRALAATGLSGLALTMLLVFWLERWRPGRPRHPVARAGRRPPPHRRTRSAEVLA